MQLGFVIDQSRCIGCHACTVACKAENDVPVGSFRTWVKYTEAGSFPEVKRSFSVLRCNQCTDAPCVTICPVRALEKRPDGIVDVDPKACIGCKSCMHGCPYDALYINPGTGTAEKCHFCAHRTEQGLAPACAVVCPTEAIVPGDFGDSESVVSRMRREFDLVARKTEAGTGPNVYYREGAPAGLDPNRTTGATGHIWADRHPGVAVDALEFDALERQAEARTTYDVAHPALWGGKIVGYLLAKGIAAGVFMAGVLGSHSPFVRGAGEEPRAAVGIPLLALVFLAITSLLLVFDLKRPERFLYILLRPNWKSWLVRGTWALMTYGALLTVWLGYGLAGSAPPLRWLLVGLTFLAATVSAAYTAWLFGQAKGRVLWMKRSLGAELVVQAFVAGFATLILCVPVFGWEEGPLRGLSIGLVVTLLLHGWLVGFVAQKKSPVGREKEFDRVTALLHRGPFALPHRLGVLGLGVLVPVLTLVASFFVPFMEIAVPFAAFLALVGLWVEEEVLVRAGQALPIS